MGQDQSSSGPRKLSEAAQKRILNGEPWLRIWSKELGVSLDEIAHKTGLHISHVILIASEDVEPEREELEAIAKALGTTVDEIEAVQD